MARAPPLDPTQADPAARAMMDRHGVTNMKRTLAHVPIALDASMRWYDVRGKARLSHYVASKWGLVGLTKSWAIELAPHDGRVVSIHPIGVNTPMNDGLAVLEGLTPLQVAGRWAGNLPPVPWIDPSDAAEAVVSLASDAARLVTGSRFVLGVGLSTR